MSRLPALKSRQIVAALKRAGFVERRQKGGHCFLWNPQTHKVTTVAQHSGDLKMGTLRAIIKQVGLTEEQFIELL